MKNLYRTLHFIINHPATRKSKLAAIKRFFQWQLHARILDRPVVYPFIQGSKLVIKRGMTGATGNIYTGLHEFEEMMFLLHLLRAGDLFCDVGANIGSYTILASAVIKARTLSFEPVPSTFLHLKDNVNINSVDSRVELFNCGLGNQRGLLHFTRDLDTVNHVMTDDEIGGQVAIEVEIKTLDQVLEGRAPLLIKMDVEGFELSVLKGATKTIENPDLKAIIIEINGACRRYGVAEGDIHLFLCSVGFYPGSYNAFERSFTRKTSFNQHGNTIYVRDGDFVNQRLQEAASIQVLDQRI